jgi:DNA-binding SARP family transcriptional activator
LQPTGSPQAEREIDLLLVQLSRPEHAEIAAEWAAKIAEPRLRAGLLLRQTQLIGDSPESGDLIWQVYQSGHLPESQIDIACQTWNAAEQWARTVEAIEKQLRAGHPIKPPLRLQLAAAYKGAGRDSDARRAETQDIDTNAATNKFGTPQGGRGGGFF